MKSPQGNPNQFKLQKCKQCNVQIFQVFYFFIKNMSHKCIVIRNLE